MNHYSNVKPIYRSKLRVFLGKRYYRLLRYLQWYFGKKKYSKEKSVTPLKYIYFTHKTPLYRKLRNVDMWLQHNKVQNLEIALKRVNGIVIYSISYEDGSDVIINDMKLAVRVYERYSMAGGNRVSLNITLLGNGDDLFITAITSGGSQAVFFKLNTIGEETFLDHCIQSVENYIKQH